MAAVVLVPVLMVESGMAWGREGHMMISRLAGQTLPADVPEFLRTAGTVDALEYLGPEPDRWREKIEPELKAAQEPEHFIDLEWADLVGPLPRNRYDFVRAVGAYAAAHPERAKDFTVEKIGLQPYATIEMWERLKAAMREYRKLTAAKENTKPVEMAIVVYAGILGHYVADGSMPMHTSIQYNGWTGPNPKGYTVEHRIHGLFEGSFVSKNVKIGDVAAAMKTKPVVMGDVFVDYVAYLRHSNSLIDRTYELEKLGGYKDAGTAEGKAFVVQQMAAGATELRDMIYTAWVKSAEPVPEYRN